MSGRTVVVVVGSRMVMVRMMTPTMKRSRKDDPFKERCETLQPDVSLCRWGYSFAHPRGMRRSDCGGTLDYYDEDDDSYLHHKEIDEVGVVGSRMVMVRLMTLSSSGRIRRGYFFAHPQIGAGLVVLHVHVQRLPPTQLLLLPTTTRRRRSEYPSKIIHQKPLPDDPSWGSIKAVNATNHERISAMMFIHSCCQLTGSTRIIWNTSCASVTEPSPHDPSKGRYFDIKPASVTC
jgi:hypothetical protein